MKLKNKYYITIILLTFSFYSTYSQSNLLNATHPSQIGERAEFEKDLDPDTPLDYGIVQDKDILFSKMIWEVIDVSQRVNFPYLYPIDSTVVGNERRPLIYYIREIAKRNGRDSISLYEDDNGEFNKPMNQMARSKVWKYYIKREVGTSLTDDPYTTINDAIIDEDLTWPIPVPATSSLEKSDAHHVFLEKNEDGKYIEESITEQQFINFYNVDDDETGSLDINGNLLTDVDEIERFNKIIDEIIIEAKFEEGIHFEWDLFEWDDIVSWKIKGLWYFDNILSELKYRVIAIAPIAEILGFIDLNEGAPLEIDGGEESNNSEPCEDENGNEIPCPEEETTDEETTDEEATDEETTDEDVDTEEEDANEDVDTDEVVSPSGGKVATKRLFWIYYPEIRNDLAKAYVFSERNSAVRKSFDELINSRRFEAVIYREENVYEDRDLYDIFPRNSFMRLLESERIKDKIRNLEHDMWSW